MLDALEKEKYPLALERQSELCSLIAALIERQPQLSQQLWERYAELLYALVAKVHPLVCAQSTSPPELQERAELCWRLMELLEDGRQRPFNPAEWLAVLEQQLVQDGSQFWLELGHHERCIGMTLRLATLLDPGPDWVLQRARDQIQQWLNAADWLGEDTNNEAFAQGCRTLGRWLKRWPLSPPEQAAMELALLRMELSLQLLEHQPSTGKDEGEGLQELELVIDLQAQPRLKPSQLNLAPLLSSSTQELETALQAFVAQRGANQPARSGLESLQESLKAQLEGGRRLPLGSYGLLSYALASWERQLGDRHPAIPPVDVQGQLVVELERYELAVLLALSRSDPALEPALVELRRQHHNASFWETPQSGSWYGIPTALESLRALQAQGGFYASAHAPMESLRSWAQPCFAALLGADGLWGSEADCQGLWLALGQQLGGQTRPLLPPPKVAEWLRGLAGKEIIYIGWNCVQLQKAHRSGALFTGAPFGLRGLEPADSRRGLRPDRDFGLSLEQCLQELEKLHQQRPFNAILTDAGAYRLPLVQAARNRYGTRALACKDLTQWIQSSKGS